MLRAALAALFPPQCVGCSRNGCVLCARCWPLRTSARTLPVGTFAVRAAGRYAGSLRRAILACKRGRRDACDALAALLVERCGTSIGERAILVPVPTSFGRRQLRGFDQGARLAQAFGLGTGHPVLLALRTTTRTAQHGLDRAGRLRARGRFVCVASTLVEGLEIVLVDDVVTTGATLRECAAALAACGASVRGAVVVAYA